MYIIETKDKQIIKSIVTHPKLFELTGHVGDPAKYRPNLKNKWFLVKESGKILGLFQLVEFTKVTYHGHIYILPEYQKTQVSVKASNMLFSYLKSFTRIRKIIAPTPQECDHIFLFLDKLDFKACGLIPRGIVYNNRLQDLILLEKEVV